MIDGTYEIKVKTPLGHKSATVVLRTEGETLFADIDAPLIGKRSAEGRVEGDTFTAEGSGKLKFVGQIDFTLKGEVSGDDLHVEIESNKGNLTLEGVRVS